MWCAALRAVRILAVRHTSRARQVHEQENAQEDVSHILKKMLLKSREIRNMTVNTQVNTKTTVHEKMSMDKKMKRNIDSNVERGKQSTS